MLLLNLQENKIPIYLLTIGLYITINKQGGSPNISWHLFYGNSKQLFHQKANTNISERSYANKSFYLMKKHTIINNSSHSLPNQFIKLNIRMTHQISFEIFNIPTNGKLFKYFPCNYSRTLHCKRLRFIKEIDASIVKISLKSIRCMKGKIY